MGKARVLYVANGHPEIRSGGAEQHAYELYQAMQRSGDFEPILLARTGEAAHRPALGTRFRAIGTDPNQILIYTDQANHFLQTQSDKGVFTIAWRDFLLAYRPDVVHFQHTSNLGVEAIRVARDTLPDAPIALTLHEYLYICHAGGQMVREHTKELCSQSSPPRCSECFPALTREQFFLRERFLKSHLAFVDAFIAPSRFLRERYVQWGLPEEKLVYIGLGRAQREPLRARSLATGEQRNRFGYFGQLNPYKGLLELLEAVQLLNGSTGPEIHLYVNGANLDAQSAEFQRRYRELVGGCGAAVSQLGTYSRAELTERMEMVDWVVVPSIWWENSPMVIGEAFLHGRPVICSDIGGMKEKVTDGIDGLYFKVGAVVDLSRTLARAASTNGLWERLRSGIPPVFSVEGAVAAHTELYRGLINKRRGSSVDRGDESNPLDAGCA